MGLTSEDVACAQQMPNIFTMIKSMTIDHDQACAAYEHLGSAGSIFNADQSEEIATVIKASMASNVVAPTARHDFAMQTHKFVHKYLPAKLWEVLFSSETMKNKKRFF